MDGADKTMELWRHPYYLSILLLSIPYHCFIHLFLYYSFNTSFLSTSNTYNCFHYPTYLSLLSIPFHRFVYLLPFEHHFLSVSITLLRLSCSPFFVDLLISFTLYHSPLSQLLYENYFFYLRLLLTIVSIILPR